jgi:hypothetical protein
LRDEGGRRTGMAEELSASADDAAWVSLSLTLAPQALQDMLCDVKVLLRVNPCLEFERLEQMPGGRLELAGRNDSNHQAFATGACYAARKDGRGFVLRYDSGIKRETHFEIAPALDTDPGGSVLTITEVYDTPAEAERERRLAEVDRSLVPWAAALRAHLLHHARWGNWPGYRWLVERFWLGMPPRQRRVARLIIWTTLLEFVVFVAVLAVYVAG